MGTESEGGPYLRDDGRRFKIPAEESPVVEVPSLLHSFRDRREIVYWEQMQVRDACVDERLQMPDPTRICARTEEDRIA